MAMRKTTPLDTPCRVWNGARAGGAPGTPWEAKYGERTRRGRNSHLVHRWVWEQINGPIPEGMVVMHRCDNPPCFRYDHLQLGTQADNVRDAMSKGRAEPGAHQLAKTHCPEGHPYDDVNTYHRSNGHRGCRACRAEASRRCKSRKKTKS